MTTQIPMELTHQRNRKHTHIKHYLQVKIPTIDRGECMSNAIWSDLESIVLSEFCAHDGDKASTKLQNDIVYFANPTFCTNFLPQNVV